ncbi:FAD-dependent monooxygenase [Streptomyces marincola]|uniref:FAD-dependent monooxygenase n=1 Tax=Streptomyces marincola TaxID=2878388 RepID=UPI001CF1881F|nr:FAD-dependent monooxygenase [Streptomyces marincola]UCM87078.1 FAD-dependent monooxygenase [Streptomyces marincola]
MDTDVIIVGAGPTGLMLAGELRLQGAGVIVIDRLAEPTGQSRGLGFTARAMEVFDQRGLLPRFGKLETSPFGHFGGIQFDYTVLPDAHFGARGIPQSQTEDVLAGWAVELGADLRRGWEFRALAEEEGRVVIDVGTPEGDRRLSASYLVGCDGGHSAVRKAAGIDFPGTPPTRDMYLADVRGRDLAPRFLGERKPEGMVMAAPLGGGVHRIIVCPHGTVPRERGQAIPYREVADAWLRITGEDISDLTPGWVSSFTDATGLAAQYRRGRVLLAGDAAHVHLPAGGQGLSFGVQDAVNLGWKLAADIRGWAPPGLLDTYHTERHAAGVRLLLHTRLQGQSFLGGDEAEPLRAVLTELIAHEDVRRHLAGSVSHLDLRYDVGPGEHPLLGRRLPPRAVRTVNGAVTTTELLRGGQGLLLDLSGGQGAGSAELATAGERWKSRVVTVHGRLPDPAVDAVLAGTGALLARPDGHIVWTAADDVRLQEALERWFGPAPADG